MYSKYFYHVKKVLKATKIRIYPNEEQESALAKQFGGARWIYNYMLDKKQAAYKAGTKLSVYDLKKLLVPLKKAEETSWLKEVDSQALMESIFNMDRAYKNFFAKRAQYPRFKNKYQKQSIQYPQRVKLEDAMIYLPKVGYVKAVIHREIVGKIKTVTVSKTTTGKYFASILTEDGVEEPALQKDIVGNVVGLDVGLNSIFVTSDNVITENPRFLKKASLNIRRKQKQLSRRKKGSKRRSKAKLLLAKAHEKLADIRNDFQHKLSKKIADENQAVIIEDLNIKGMMKNGKLAKHIGDAGWQSLIIKLEYKLRAKGGRLVRIDRYYPSSKTCSSCGYVKESLKLVERVYECKECNHKANRDLNAAINIRNKGIEMLIAEGQSVTAR